MKRSRLLQSNQSNHNNNSTVDSKGLTSSPIAGHQHTATVSGLSKDDLSRVCFGGPGERTGLAYLSLVGGEPVEGGGRQPGGDGRDVAAERVDMAAVGEAKNVVGVNALAKDCGVGSSNLPAPSSTQVVARASAGTAEASGGGGKLKQGRAFLTGVPSTHIKPERLVNQATPTGAISTSVSNLEGMEGSCPSDSATLASGVTAGGRGGDDADFGVGKSPAGRGGSGERGGNAKQAEEVSQSCRPLASSFGNSSVAGSTEFPQHQSATDHSTEALTTAAVQPWSDTSEYCSGRCWAANASADSEVPKSWQMGNCCCSFTPAGAATSDGESYCSACGRGDRVARSSGGDGSSTCSAGLEDFDGNGSKPHHHNNNNNGGDSSNDNGGPTNRMRSYVSSHADPSEKQNHRHPRVGGATWRLTPSSGDDDDDEALRGDDLVSRDPRSKSGSDNGSRPGRGRRAADRLLPAGQEQTHRSVSEGRPRRLLWREPCVPVSGSGKRMTTPR